MTLEGMIRARFSRSRREISWSWCRFQRKATITIRARKRKAPTIMPVSWPLVKVEAAGAGVVVVVDVGEAVGELDPLQHPLWQP